MNSKRLLVSTALSLFLVSASVAGAKTCDETHKAFDLKGPGQLSVDVESSNVAVTTWDKSQVDVKITRVVSATNEKREKELLGADKIELRQDGDKVIVSIDTPDGWGGFWSWINRDYRVDIKAPVACSAKLRTSGGNIDADMLQGTVEARTNGGDVALRHIVGNAKAGTNGGNIKIDAIKGDVDAGTSGGNAIVTNGEGNLSVHTSGGNVSVSFAASPSGPVKIGTMGGGVSLVLPAEAKVHINAHTVGGGISTQFPLTTDSGYAEDRMQGDINGGGPSVDLNTTGGSIHIAKGK